MAPNWIVRAGFVTVVAIGGAGCAQKPAVGFAPIVKVSYSALERDCLARAMYFESHRGSDDGMLAVGTVVANRVKSGAYGGTVCEVVTQKRQFAPGVMIRTMDGEAAERARRAADAVLAGKRHPGVRGAMFFHTAGIRFPYPNMHYVLVAGGNAFYEKRSVASPADARDNARSRAMALAYAKADPTAAAKPIVVASLGAQPAAQPAAALAPQPVVRTIVTTQALAPQTTAVATPTAAQPAPLQTATIQPQPVQPAKVRTIALPAAPMQAASLPTIRRRPAPTRDEPAEAVAFAPSPSLAAFPSSGGGRYASASSSPVSDAWAAFDVR